MSDKVKKVSVTALKAHTNDGKSYDADDTYDVPEADVANLVAQGMAKPSDDVEAEKDAAKDQAKADAKAAKAAGHPVTPMDTDDLDVKPKHKK